MRQWICAVVLFACERAPTRPPVADTVLAEAAVAAGNKARAIELFGRACNAGDQHACARQGFILVENNHDPERARAAVKLWTIACDRANDALACANLGSFYDDGEIVPRDPSRAAALYAKACNGDDGLACGMLAIDRWQGIGVTADLNDAARLAEKGCRLGSPSACTALGIGLIEAWGGSADPVRAVSLFRDSCAKNDLGGCCQLGLSLRDGRGVAADLEQAKHYIEQACNESDRRTLGH